MVSTAPLIMIPYTIIIGIDKLILCFLTHTAHLTVRETTESDYLVEFKVNGVKARVKIPKTVIESTVSDEQFNQSEFSKIESEYLDIRKALYAVYTTLINTLTNPTPTLVTFNSTLLGGLSPTDTEITAFIFDRVANFMNTILYVHKSSDKVVVTFKVEDSILSMVYDKQYIDTLIQQTFPNGYDKLLDYYNGDKVKAYEQAALLAIIKQINPINNILLNPDKIEQIPITPTTTTPTKINRL